jgi:hypothetical protein
MPRKCIQATMGSVMLTVTTTTDSVGSSVNGAEYPNAPDVAITALDVTVRSDLLVPATTECDGVWVEVQLRSGRVLRCPPCAMPGEIARLRDSAYRVSTG